MPLPDSRWHAVSPSPFEHEQQGLDILRQILPDESPFHVWTNFEFPDEDGQWHEVDALVLARTQLILLELKYYSGTLTGTGLRWERPGHAPQRSPLAGAKKKADRFRSLLERTLKAAEPGAARQRIIPYVDYAVFLHHPRFRNAMAPTDSGRRRPHRSRAGRAGRPPRSRGVYGGRRSPGPRIDRRRPPLVDVGRRGGQRAPGRRARAGCTGAAGRKAPIRQLLPQVARRRRCGIARKSPAPGDVEFRR